MFRGWAVKPLDRSTLTCYARFVLGRHWQYFSSTALYHTPAQEAATRMLDRFNNTTFIRRQLIDANQLQKLILTLGRPTIPPSLGSIGITDEPPRNGTPVPPGYHLVYFTPNALEDELGADGTDMTFNTPPPFTRRMWAGGRMSWPKDAELRVGDVAEERTRLLSVTAKKSKSVGEMVLMEVEKEIWTLRGRVLVDNRAWVFRPVMHPKEITVTPEKINANAQAPSASTDTRASDGSVLRNLSWSPTALFRFSALTFNGHKIHYDENWAKTVEGHPELVVHGPLTLISILDYWRDVYGGQFPHSIRYRVMAPIYAGENYSLRSEELAQGPEGNVWRIIADKGGVACVQGDITGHR